MPAYLVVPPQNPRRSLVEKPQNCLFKLRERGGRRDNPAAEPKREAQTEATAIGDHDELLNLVHEPFATLAVAMESVMDLFDIPPNQRKLSLHRVGHVATIRRCHASPRV